MNLIEEIKNRINILDVVRDFGIEVRRGNFISSIYKDERNPSLKLYPETNSYYDFSSGKGGDVIDFFAHKKNIDLSAAIKELGRVVGVENNKTAHRKREKTAPRQTVSIFLNKNEKEYFGEMAGYFEYYQNTNRNEAEKNAYKVVINNRLQVQEFVYDALAKFCNGVDNVSFKYLTGPKRGLTKETIEFFKLFSITDANRTIAFLKDNFSMDDLKIAGLFTSKGGFVFWNHKIIIPFIENGKIVYLRGRHLPEGRVETGTFRKYIGLCNTSGNLTAKRFFNKDVLKGMGEDFDLAICEGEFDAMIMVQGGHRAIGIPGANNFPKNEARALEKFTICLAFDSDEPGQKAVNEIAKLFNKRVFGIKLKKHKDLTEFVNAKT